uniref:Gylcosyl hydrolase 115 C-terminal domain-containing protein n=1 Tax=Bionectria ochroleuca TaxID=29856 RepID=A0A8H7K789_BIOOC
MFESPFVVTHPNDFEGIKIAVRILSEDFSKVTGGKPNPVVQPSSFARSTAIIIGSITNSSIIKTLIEEKRLDVSAIKDQWECYTTQLVSNPLKGCKQALVIVGSDKRGTIFGTYTLSQQIGVSPFYFWSDVPVKKASDLYALDTTTRDGPPTVKYRGLFINDESPCLTEWVKEKIGPKYNVAFYKKVFELLLRLKANFLWPAMWNHPGQSFFVDDALNQKTADEYGIVMSTSHHEPMQRAMNEWFREPYNEPEGSWSWLTNKEKITKYFQEGAERAKPFESVLTLGMRGKGDHVIDAKDVTSTLHDILHTQRSIIKDVYGSEAGENQVLALYKEVLTQYDQGLEIPDDVTLLFADDNQGSIRRVLVGDEKRRSGGAGIYYHFEFVGHPRSYKWLNSNHLPKAWQQLDEAYNNGVDRIWIFNVGDIKPMEVPLSFAMMKAWNTHALTPSQLPVFFDAFIDNTFSLSAADSKECSQLLFEYDQLMGLGKHECIEDDTFSVIYYDEADTVLRRWSDLLGRSTLIYEKVPTDLKPAIYQLIHHPIKATQIYIALRVALGKNKRFAEQRRTIANKYAQEVLRLFQADFDLSNEYHGMLGGKWNHIMDQPHYGCRWEEDIAPFRDMIPGLCYVQSRQKASPIMGSFGIAVEGHAGYRTGLCCEEHDLLQPSRGNRVPSVTTAPLEPLGARSRWFEIYSHSSESFHWSVKSDTEWLSMSISSGYLTPEDSASRVHVFVDWVSVPELFDGEALLEVRSDTGSIEVVHVPIKKRKAPVGYTGFIESDQLVSINATNFDALSIARSSYKTNPLIGRTGAGGVLLAARANDADKLDFLHYSFFNYTPMTEATVTLYFTMTFNTEPSNPIEYDICVDDLPHSTFRLVPDAPNPGTMPPGDLPAGWMEECPRLVWTRKHTIDLTETGAHVLKIRLRHTNSVLEKVVIDLGGVRPSYLGPPESKRSK